MANEHPPRFTARQATARAVFFGAPMLAYLLGLIFPDGPPPWLI